MLAWGRDQVFCPPFPPHCNILRPPPPLRYACLPSHLRAPAALCRALPCCAAKHTDEEGGSGMAASEPSWGEVLSSRAAIVGMLLFVFQQFSGINAIVYFSSSGV